MKNKTLKIFIVLSCIFLLTGCTKTLKDSDKKAVINETTGQRTYEYERGNTDNLLIMQSMNIARFHIDNERSESRAIMINNMEVILYDFSDEIVAVMQYKDNWITIEGNLDEKELEKVVIGMNIPD